MVQIAICAVSSQPKHCAVLQPEDVLRIMRSEETRPHHLIPDAVAVTGKRTESRILNSQNLFF